MVLEESSASGKLEALIEKVRALVEAEAAKRASAPAVVPGGPAALPPPPSPAKPVVPAPRAQPAPRPRPASIPAFQIVVTPKGFEPDDVKVPAGKPVTLRFERKTEKTCATEIVMEVDGKKVVKDLPLNKPVELTLTFSRPGRVGYACAMDMIRGSITVQ
jgi:plastocyanin